MSAKRAQEKSKEIASFHKHLSQEFAQLNEAESILQYGDKFDYFTVTVTNYFEALDVLKTEIRGMDDSISREWKKKFKALRSDYTDDMTLYKELKERYDRERLHENGVAGYDDEQSNEEMIKEGRDLMASNKQALTETLQTVHEAKTLGLTTVEMLHQQHEQMERVDGNLDQMETSLEVSRRLIKNLARRMMTDKYLWVMIFIVVCAIIAVVVVNWLI